MVHRRILFQAVLHLHLRRQGAMGAGVQVKMGKGKGKQRRRCTWGVTYRMTGIALEIWENRCRGRIILQHYLGHFLGVVHVCLEKDRTRYLDIQEME